MWHIAYFIKFLNFNSRPFFPTEFIKSNQSLLLQPGVILLFLFSDVIEPLTNLNMSWGVSVIIEDWYSAEAVGHARDPGLQRSGREERSMSEACRSKLFRPGKKIRLRPTKGV
jgi:hypothetical protein